MTTRIRALVKNRVGDEFSLADTKEETVQFSLTILKIVYFFPQNKFKPGGGGESSKEEEDVESASILSVGDSKGVDIRQHFLRLRPVVNFSRPRHQVTSSFNS